jgi:hypothetical protein
MNDPTRAPYERRNAMTANLKLEPRVVREGLLRTPRMIAGLGESLFTHFRSAVEPCRLPIPVPIPVRRPLPKRAALALGLALCGALAMAPAARASSAWQTSADGRLVDVEVLVDGNSAPLYWKPGAWDRRYFQAFRGRNYSLAVTNQTGRRVGVLIAVDGVNVVSGDRSNLAGTEPMYVLGPYERAVIRGWRTSLRDVRRFVFVDEERSYAERTGQANGDMGWIRVLSFREREPQVYIEPRERRDHDWEPYGSREQQRDEAAAPKTEGGETGNGKQRADAPSTRADGAKPQAESFRGLPAPAPESNPGTGWGDRSWDPVERTVFLAAWSATDRVSLRYEYESGLVALGIYPRTHRTWERENGELSFARVPRW